MSVFVIGSQLLIFEILYRRYGMSKNWLLLRLVSVCLVMCVPLFATALSSVQQYNCSVLLGGLCYIAIIDYKMQRIPNTFLLFLLINRIVLCLQDTSVIQYSVVSAIVWLAGLGLLHKLLKNGFGAGDVKLMSVIGGYIGLWHSTVVLLLSCACICIIGTIRFLIKRDHLNVSLPMAPFVCLSFGVVFSHSLIFLGGFTL
ncbi:prepilin peptidase [Carnobacteriaceae bacterium zg-C25]|nr:prepilin peptidase [Carnobacteriaceae bacterium zg-C25]